MTLLPLVAGVHERGRGMLSIVVVCCCVGANETNTFSSAHDARTARERNDRGQAAYLRDDDRIGDLLNHPAFAGFGRLTLPWDDRQLAHDLAAAVDYIFRNAAALRVSTTAYSLWGSSAGARMAAAIGSDGTARFGAPERSKPAAIVMAYTGHSELASNEPATFVVVGERDGIAPPSTMERRVALLRQAGTEVEYHKYPGLGDGFGLGTGTSAEGWAADAVRFWEKQMRASRFGTIER